MNNILPTFFLGLLLVSASCLTWADKPPSQQDLKKIQAAIDTQLQQINTKNSKRQTLLKQLESTEKEQARTQKKINSLHATIQKQKKSLESLHKEQQILEQKKQKQTQQIASLIGTTYRLGKESRIKLFLNQENPQQISRALTYAGYINQSHSDVIATYKNTIRKLDSIKPDIESRKASLEKQYVTLLKEKRALTKHLNTRKKLLSTLNNDIKSDKGRLSELKSDQKKLIDLLKAVEKAIINIRTPADSTPFAKIKGKLPKPATGKMLNGFGKRIDNTSIKGQGVSFYAPEGSPVKAVHYGRVVFSGWFRGKGLLIIIDHGKGYMTLYAHNQTLLHETGDWVHRGNTIATVGDSGGLDHSELYFEIRHQGEALNPAKWFQ